MAFLSLYRKYRPQGFDDLVGQEHVVRTLKNAIKKNRISHAYLFAGPRGTGKTSTAKVFARAINCINGPTITPCGECKTCKNIQSGRSMDVIEIDAASNRGVDEIRELREKVKFYPGEGNYKVYIIDEVHMLTRGAFNALLKTLEEPPESVVFILATTEPHKVIETILSRCQRFDFSLLTKSEIEKRLGFICQKEGVHYSPEAVQIVAESANGGMRDAISILDQAISYTDAELSADKLQKMLGKVDKRVLIEFSEHIINNRTPEVLEMFNELINRGNGISIFINDLTEYFRQLLLIKECGKESGLVNYNQELLEEFEKASQTVKTSRLISYLEILNGAEKDLKYTDKPRMVVELGLIRMTSSSAEELNERISRLEEILTENKGNHTNIGNKNRKKEKVSWTPDDKLQKDNKDNNKDEIKVGESKVKDKSKAKDENKGSEVKNKKAVKNIGREKAEAPGKEGDLDLARIKKAWPTILKLLKKKDISVQAFLMEGKPDKLQGENLIISFPADKSFHQQGAEAGGDLIQKAVNTVLKSKLTLKFSLEGKESEKAKKKSPDERKGNEHRESNNDKTTEELIRAFKGEIIKVDYDVLEEK